MNIITRFNIQEPGFTGRVYIHPFGFNKVYGTPADAIRHLKDVIRGNNLKNVKEKNLNYTHAIMWGDKERDKMIDFCGIHRKVGDIWPGNPDIYQWVTKKGVIIPAKDGILETTCSQGFIIFSEEIGYMGRAKNPNEYLERAPRIPELKFKIEDMCKPLEKRG